MNSPSGGTAATRILIADDHPFFRRGLREVLEEQRDLRVVAEANDGEEAIDLVQQLRPEGLDLVLMDMAMPRMNGITATRAIHRMDPSLPVIMLTVSTADADLLAAAAAGVSGFLTKGLTPAAIVRALYDFRSTGALPMPRTMATVLLKHLQGVLEAFPQADVQRTPAPEGPGGLSRREREIAECIARGMPDRAIAERLVLAPTTVKTHVQNILRKLDARNRAEAVAKLHQAVPPGPAGPS